MADRKSYSEPGRGSDSRESGASDDRSVDRDREKNLGSRHSGDPSQRSGSSRRESGSDRSSDPGETGSSDADRER